MLQRFLISCLILLISMQSWGQLSTSNGSADNPFNDLSANTPLTDSALTTEAEPEFLPVDQAFQLAMEFTPSGSLYLNWQITEGYYLYKHAFKFELVENGQTTPLSPTLSDGIKTEDEYFGPVEIYYHHASVEITELPDQETTLAVTSQGCADAGLCYPPQTIYLKVNAGTKTLSEPSKTPPTQSESTTASLSKILWMSLLAMAGGIILNVMPCVFPVLSLKVMGFANDHQHSTKAHGLAYGAGVVASFVAIALLMISLRSAGESLGWGFQLQSSWFVALLVYLFLVMGLSLSGMMEFGGSWMNVGSSLTRISGYQGSFFTGILATVVASPCTAPFMGSALGFAATQTTGNAIVIFAALGAGMALPVVLLSFSPHLMKLMPKPGSWMDSFKQFLAFPLYATAIWLCWVIGKQTGVNGMSAVLVGCLLIALALWFWDRKGLWSSKLLRRLIAIACAALAFSILNSPLLSNDIKETAINKDWEYYSPEQLSSLRKQGQKVFLNVTADWCITCLANERLVLSSETIAEAMKANNIIYMKADWTNYDPAITELLKQFNRNGIPLYVYFSNRTGSQPIVLPQLLTTETVIQTFNH